MSPACLIVCQRLPLCRRPNSTPPAYLSVIIIVTSASLHIDGLLPYAAGLPPRHWPMSPASTPQPACLPHCHHHHPHHIIVIIIVIHPLFKWNLYFSLLCDQYFFILEIIHFIFLLLSVQLKDFIFTVAGSALALFCLILFVLFLPIVCSSF
jgi:hypothetical protein